MRENVISAKLWTSAKINNQMRALLQQLTKCKFQKMLIFPPTLSPLSLLIGSPPRYKYLDEHSAENKNINSSQALNEVRWKKRDTRRGSYPYKYIYL